jgi:hypothetical protein
MFKMPVSNQQLRPIFVIRQPQAETISLIQIVKSLLNVTMVFPMRSLVQLAPPGLTQFKPVIICQMYRAVRADQEKHHQFVTRQHQIDIILRIPIVKSLLNVMAVFHLIMTVPLAPAG